MITNISKSLDFMKQQFYNTYMDNEEKIFRKFKILSPHLNEKALRLFLATEANEIGYGGVSAVFRATGVARTTITRGIKELKKLSADQPCELSESTEPDSHIGKIRAVGGGRKPITTTFPEIMSALEKLVEPMSIGDPCSPLRWTLKSTRTLANELKSQGFNVTQTTVRKLLRDLGYSLQANRKSLASTKQHPDRNAQFEYKDKNIKK
ncbi:MAG: hypothetical protein LBS60_03760 [Deltaproteobacteria bacterium]|jgi:hypothetical protein|nr:hypothetical protein [Deltaproteobacteria bacterium]